MIPVALASLRELQPSVERVTTQLFVQLAVMTPDGEVHHIGATAIPGSITKGDVDVLIHVSADRFASVVETLRKHFTVKQPQNWTSEFASFSDDTAYELPVGVQVVVKDSKEDFLLFLRDYFIANPSALEQYNRLKMDHAHEGAEGYWKAKDKFLAAILNSRWNQSNE